MTKRTPVADAPLASSDSSAAIDALTEDTNVAGIIAIPTSDIDAHPANPRDELGDLTELADSIREHGIRQPLLVVPAPKAGTGRFAAHYRAVIGHRRLAAATLAGLDTVPAVVDSTLDDAQQLELMLVENLQRTDLTPFEEGRGYQGLLDLGLTQTAIAKKTGRAAKTVKGRLALANVDARVEARVKDKQLTLEQAIVVGDIAVEAPDLYEELVADLDKGGVMDWRISAALRKLATRKKIEASKAKVAAAGAELLEKQPYLHGEVAPLKALKITPDTHTECPGHSAYVDPWYGDIEWACTKAATAHKAELKAARGPQDAAKKETPEDKAAREELEQLVAGVDVAREHRYSWLAAQLIEGTDVAEKLVAAQHKAAVHDLAGYGFQVTNPLPEGALAATLLHAVETHNMISSWGVRNFIDPTYLKQSEWNRDSAKAEIDALEELKDLGYPLTDAEATLLEKMKAALAVATSRAKGK